MVFRKKTSRKKYARKTPIFKKINTKNMIAKKRRSNLVKLIKDINVSESEMKYKSGTKSVQSMTHNSVNELHLWAPSSSTVSLNTMPNQGTNDGTRIGDRIFIKGFKLRGMFQIAGDRLNTSISVYYVPHNSEQGSPGTFSELFHSVTGSTLMDSLQLKRFPGAKLLGRYYVKPHDKWQFGGATNTAINSGSIYMSTFIPINKKVYFKADASNQPTNLKEYGTIVIAPYNNVNALATDVLVINCDIHATVYFKDI